MSRLRLRPTLSGYSTEADGSCRRPYPLPDPVGIRYPEILSGIHYTISNVNSHGGTVLGAVPNPWRFAPVSSDKKELLKGSDFVFSFDYINDSASFTIGTLDPEFHFLHVDGDILVASETPKTTWFLERGDDPPGGFFYMSVTLDLIE